jgi:hypothetical protein
VIADGGIERANCQVCPRDDLAQLGVRVVRVLAGIDGSLDTARRDDYAGEKQGSAGRR